MANFYCVYSGKELPESDRAAEPIIPYALGGADELALRDVSRQAAADIGSRVDTPFMNSLPVAVDRLMAQVRNRDGALPALSLSGSIDIDGRTVSARYTFSEDGRSLVVEPAQGGGALRVECSAEQLLQSLASMEGKLPRSSDTALELGKALQEAAGSARRVDNPVLQGVGAIDWSVYPRAMVRLALAFGHEYLGPAFATSADAQPLRDFIWEDDPKKRALIQCSGSAWPPLPAEEDRIRRNFFKPDHHALVASSMGENIIFYGLLFGRYGASVLLSRRAAEFSERVPSGDGIVVLVNYRTREVQRQGYKDFFTMKLLGLF
jgi:hypothetical protein